MDYGSYIDNEIRKHGKDYVLDNSAKLKEQLTRYENAMLQVFFSFNLLLLIFDHLDIKHMRSLMSVCKRWNEVTQDNRFWSLLIKKKIPKDLCRYSELFDVNSYKSNSNRNSFCWIFQKNVDFTFLNGKEWLHSTKSLLIGAFIFHYNEKNELEALLKYTFYLCDWFDVIYMKTGISGVKSMYIVRDRPSKIKYKDESGLCWEGECRHNDGNYHDIVPHGEGLWIFPDNSEFRGGFVAFEGFPHGKGRDSFGNHIEYYFGHKVDGTFQRNPKRIKWC
jgi:hypothetical protein